jgi:ABC-type polysaccharide/polyol phosphate transport system ATPase subunit
MVLIECNNVSKCFRRASTAKLLRDHIGDMVHQSEEDEERFYALRNISFTVQRGHSLGVIGRNGAGKSTLLSILTGLARPDGGIVNVNGRVAALLELGSGFHPDLTGYENLYLNAALLGFTEKQTHDLQEAIVDFAEIRHAMNEPLRTYSAGMVLRLAFGVAMNLRPDVLIVDEVLAVGDLAFQNKCLGRIRELQQNGTTLVFVTHSVGNVPLFCDTAIWLHEGRCMSLGSATDIVEQYTQFSTSIIEPPSNSADPVRIKKARRST